MADAEGGETLPCKRRALNSKEIFKKSGPKREASCMPEQSTELTADARAELESRLAKVDAALQMPHSSTGKSLIVACWLHERMLAKVLQRRGNQLNHFGHGQAGTTMLLPEEALFLTESDRMVLLPHEKATQPLSLLEVMSLVLSAGISCEEYIAYSQIRRGGYIARRYGCSWHHNAISCGQKESPLPTHRCAEFGTNERDRTHWRKPMLGCSGSNRRMERGWWPSPTGWAHDEGENVRELLPSFNVWAPNPGFSKKSPDPLLFRLIVDSDGPPSAREVRRTREIVGDNTDLKFCSISNGICMIFAFRINDREQA